MRNVLITLSLAIFITAFLACDSTPAQPTLPTAATAPPAVNAVSNAATPTAEIATVNEPTPAVATATLPARSTPLPTQEVSVLFPSPTPAPTASPFPTQAPLPTAIRPVDTPVPEPTDATAFISALSEEELACMPTPVESDLELFRQFETAGNSFNNPYFNCLTADTQFAAYLAAFEESPDSPELSEETHRCIWDGLQPLFQYDGGEDVSVEDLSHVMALALFAPVAVMAYCISPEEINAVPDAEYGADLEHVKCIIDHYGSPRDFVRAVVNSEPGFPEVLAVSEERCVVEQAVPDAPAPDPKSIPIQPTTTS